MILKSLSILNYKNIAEAELQFSPGINCFIGDNGEGKTNLLDAIYFLSFTHSMFSNIDSQMMRHDADFFMLKGAYTHDDGETEENIYAGMKRGVKKQFKRNGKAYRRMAEHIGMVPLIISSPDDVLLARGGSEERRHLLDVVISQYDTAFAATQCPAKDGAGARPYAPVAVGGGNGTHCRGGIPAAQQLCRAVRSRFQQCI